MSFQHNKVWAIAAASMAAVMLAVMPATDADAAGAADYPTRAIHLIVANPPGGMTDVASRIIAAQVGSELGQAVILENRPGANSNLGARYVARSAPDGYTLVTSAINNFGSNPALFKDMPYDPIKDFRQIVLFTSNDNLLMVNPASPYHSLKDILDAARANPGKLTYGSGGKGSSLFLFMELLKSKGKVNILHVPYQGSTPADTDLMSGQIDMVFDTIPAAGPLVRSGRTRAIAVSGATRSADFPDVPTVAESGVPGFAASSWLAMAAPAGTPQEIIVKLNAAVNKALATPETRERLLKLGARPTGGTIEQAQDYVDTQVAMWKKVLGEMGVQPE